MKTVVTALLESIVHIINVAVVILVIWLMFSILGVNLFGGKFHYCSIDKLQYSFAETCEKAGGEWMRYDANFDSVPHSMLTLFIISTLEGWPDIMYQAVDATNIDQGPELNAAPYNAYFFVIFIFIGSFFFLNFFIGVIFLNYEEA